jgi:arylsulfatase A
MLTWKLCSRGNVRIRQWVFLPIVIFGPCLLLAAIVAEAQGEPSEKDFVEYRPSARVRVIPDLTYAKYGDRTLLLDLYLPPQPGKVRPGVIVVRGGGWMVNDRKRFAHVASALAERGVAAACIEYRTAEEAPFPGAIQDVKAAVRWMRANAARYRIDSHAIGTLGGSSGAQMALLVGLTAGVAEFEGSGGHADVSSQVQAVVAMATPADLLSLSTDNKRTVGMFLHATPEQDKERWRWASPVNHITAGGPPVLLLHGTADDSVPSSQSVDFARLYREAGASAEVELLSGAPHAFWNYRPWFSDVMDRAAIFLQRVAKRGSNGR